MIKFFHTSLFVSIFCLLTTCLLFSCNPFGKKAKNDKVVENFDNFYNKFHSDETFQMSRLRFPLEGGMIDIAGRKKWTKKNWQFMKIKIYDVDKKVYKIKYNKGVNDFSQKVWLENSGFSSEYKFKLINYNWYLVYALDVNL